MAHDGVSKKKEKLGEPTVRNGAGPAAVTWVWTSPVHRGDADSPRQALAATDVMENTEKEDSKNLQTPHHQKIAEAVGVIEPFRKLPCKTMGTEKRWCHLTGTREWPCLRREAVGCGGFLPVVLANLRDRLGRGVGGNNAPTDGKSDDCYLAPLWENAEPGRNDWSCNGRA